jgi:glycosyltransferase 2 family protein
MTRVDLEALVITFSQLDGHTVVGLLVLAALMPVLLARRLQVLIRSVATQRDVEHRDPRLSSVLADQLTSAAAGGLLPTAVGGDVLRVVLVGGYFSGEERQSRAIAVILVDRLIGLLALCTLPVVLGLTWTRSTLGLASVVAGGVLLLGLWWLEPMLRGVARLMPARWPRARQFVESLPRGLREVSASARRAAFGWSLAYQVCVGLFFELAAARWGVGASYHEAIWVGIPAAMVLTVLPVSIGALGWRESLFVGVFALLGLPREHGLALGLLWGAAGLLTALTGAIVALRRAARR